MSAARARGTKFETACVSVLNQNGWPHAERRSLNGCRDRGDINFGDGSNTVCEVKAQKEITLAAWMNELAVEMENAGSDVGYVWAKRKGKTSPMDGYIVVSPEIMLRLLASHNAVNNTVKRRPARTRNR